MPQVPITAGGVGLFSIGMMDFYANKSILPSWKFIAYVTTDNAISFGENLGDDAGKSVPPELRNDFAKMRYHHVVDVNIPLYKYGINKTMYGPVAKTFPMLEHDGFKIKITYEDDKDANVLGLIHRLQQTVVDENGFYRRLNKNKVGDINIHLYNDFGINVCQWVGRNAYFLGADDLTLSYSNNDTMKYGINFGCDILTFRKNASIPQSVQDAIGIGIGIGNEVVGRGLAKKLGR